MINELLLIHAAARSEKDAPRRPATREDVILPRLRKSMAEMVEPECPEFLEVSTLPRQTKSDEKRDGPASDDHYCRV